MNPVPSWAEEGGQGNVGRHSLGPRSLEVLARTGEALMAAALAEVNLGCFNIQHVLLSPGPLSWLLVGTWLEPLVKRPLEAPEC